MYPRRAVGDRPFACEGFFIIRGSIGLWLVLCPRSKAACLCAVRLVWPGVQSRCCSARVGSGGTAAAGRRARLGGSCGRPGAARAAAAHGSCAALRPAAGVLTGVLCPAGARGGAAAAGQAGAGGAAARDGAHPGHRAGAPAAACPRRRARAPRGGRARTEGLGCGRPRRSVLTVAMPFVSMTRVWSQQESQTHTQEGLCSAQPTVMRVGAVMALSPLARRCPADARLKPGNFWAVPSHPFYAQQCSGTAQQYPATRCAPLRTGPAQRAKAAVQGGARRARGGGGRRRGRRGERGGRRRGAAGWHGC